MSLTHATCGRKGHGAWSLGLSLVPVTCHETAEQRGWWTGAGGHVQ